MTLFVLRRIAWGIVLLWAISLVTFVIFYVLPSADPALIRAGHQATPQLVASIRHSLGLDRPLIVQYWTYLERAFLHLDLGYSYQNDTAVRTLILSRLPATVSVVAGAFVIWLVSGVCIGVISAVKRGKALDRFAMGAALVTISAPVYWLGLVALYLFAKDVGKFPLFDGSSSYVPLTQDPAQWFGSLILPWFVLAATLAAIYARFMRASLIDVMDQDYVRTARAKGLRERRVIVHHGVRSAITPIVTLIGLDLGQLLGGALLVEAVFNIPGLGRLALTGVQNGDLPVVQGTVMVAAFFVIVMNILVDIAYGWLDPRVTR